MLALLCIMALRVVPCFATQIWDADDGTLAFVKPAFADPTLPANQDAITQNVAITRGVTKGIYNAVSEAFYTNTLSPADTEWAFSGLNLNPAFSFGAGASSHGSLTFADWETSHSVNPLQTVGLPAVVHLVTDDIYIDIQFDSWGRGPVSGAFFSYVRASDPLAADFDGDGDVDGSDFLLWQRDPSVGSLASWEENFGTVLPAAVAVSTPEPSSLLMASLAGLLFCTRRR